MMERAILLPYDRGAVARATLHRAADTVRRHGTCGSYDGVVLAVGGVEPSAMDALLLEAALIAGADIRLAAYALDPGDPIGAFVDLMESMPDAAVAAPLGVTGRTPWFRVACLTGEPARDRLLYFLRPSEVRGFERAPARRLADALRAVKAAAARLRPAPQTGSSRAPARSIKTRSMQR